MNLTMSEEKEIRGNILIYGKRSTGKTTAAKKYARGVKFVSCEYKSDYYDECCTIGEAFKTNGKAGYIIIMKDDVSLCDFINNRKNEKQWEREHLRSLELLKKWNNKHGEINCDIFNIICNYLKCKSQEITLIFDEINSCEQFENIRCIYKNRYLDLNIIICTSTRRCRIPRYIRKWCDHVISAKFNQ